MKRTTVYLEEAQSAALGRAARAQGISRAKLIRQLIDRGICGSGADDLEADLAAIRDSFGVLRDEDAAAPGRGPDERSRHLERVARRRSLSIATYSSLTCAAGHRPARDLATLEVRHFPMIEDLEAPFRL